MDLLVKHNLIKKNKIIIDIGRRWAKCLEVNYSPKKITIKRARRIESGAWFINNVFTSYQELAQAVHQLGSSTKKSEISISLPENLVDSRIITIKNRKLSDLKKTIETEHNTFGKVTPLTHYISHAYLGTREIGGESVHYCLLVAVSKNLADDIVSEFYKMKLTISTLSFATNDLICLSQLYCTDYQHLNRMMVDFGDTGTRIVCFCNGTPFYIRTINTGFNNYVDALFFSLQDYNRPQLREVIERIGEVEGSELLEGISSNLYYHSLGAVSSRIFGEVLRIYEHCVNNGVGITKIICTGYVIKGFEKYLTNDLIVQKPDLNFSLLKGKNFVVSMDEVEIDDSYANAVGLAIHTLL